MLSAKEKLLKMFFFVELVLSYRRGAKMAYIGSLNLTHSIMNDSTDHRKGNLAIFSSKMSVYVIHRFMGVCPKLGPNRESNSSLLKKVILHAPAYMVL